ncbi:MAG: hypothetical protein JWR02_2354 [Mucilaginibacter sp.]|nr:hypothetical protein [Mucilaginibacter sp.]
MINDKANILNLPLFIVGLLLLTLGIASCGKQASNSPVGLNIQYQILNLSPDLFPVNLYVDNQPVNSITNPFVYNVNHNYFYVPSVDTPYQIRTALSSGLTLFSRHDILKSGLKYTLFITGASSDHSLAEIFTTDTASAPVIGRGKLRFVNASPTATTGLDISANGTTAFSKIPYKTVSKYIELPIGNYDLQVKATGSTNILKDLPAVTIQDGRLYTLYSYGYTTRIDTAAFNAAILINK